MTTTSSETPAPAGPCASCGTEFRKSYRRCPVCEGKRNRASVDSMERAIVTLKAGAPADETRRLIKEISDLGHPDVEGLLQAIGIRR